MDKKVVISAASVCLVAVSFGANALSVSQTQSLTMQGSESFGCSESRGLNRFGQCELAEQASR